MDNTRPLEDAKDAEIARLRAELERYRWIPVEERLPEKNGTYMIFIPGENEYKSEAQISEFDLEDFLWGFHDNSIVTHWMPLPPAPDEEVE